jgi:CDP-paratose 2-epimerase
MSGEMDNADAKHLVCPVLGVQEWLQPGAHQRVEALLADLRALNVRELRMGFSWADWHTKEDRAWYEWLLPRLASEVNVTLYFTFAPPRLELQSKAYARPRNPRDYADFLDLIITGLGEHFTWIELWNECNNINGWSWRLDPEWKNFYEMIGAAAYRTKQRGKKTLLSGMAPMNPHWLESLCERGVIKHIDAVGVQGFPGTREFDWYDWRGPVGKLRDMLRHHSLDPEIWITATGYSTWRYDEFRQLCMLDELLQAPVERIYWYSFYDLHRDQCHQNGFREDERHYHFGLKNAHGKPKLLYRTWANEGIEGVRALAVLGRYTGANLPQDVTTRQPAKRAKVRRSTLITGGAGFIGINLAARLLADKRDVLIFDNLCRPGVEQNLRWLCDTYGNGLQVEIADIRDPCLLRKAVQNATQVFHLAAQVAVTTSLETPLEDFDINVRGTLNVLEAMRGMDDPPALVFTSSNKVYGALEDVLLHDTRLRYEPSDLQVRRTGIDETRPLDFHSPYGCSKGAADQYVLDYARSFGLPAAVFRMSCIYGPHQFGNEDQGWVAHFLIRAMEGEPITIYGDGRQVRDVLYVDDLIDALLVAQRNIAQLSGKAFNIGGGTSNTLSLLEFIEHIAELEGVRPKLRFGEWRSGDQKHFVSDITRFRRATGWSPKVSVRDGIAMLASWIHATRDAASRMARPAAAQ